MARRDSSSEEQARREDAVDLRAFVGKDNPKRKNSWNVEVTRSELEAMLRSGDWSEAKPKHFAELFLRMHERVYGVEALEALPKKIRMSAASLAAGAMRKHFNGDPKELAHFVRWVWIDQQRRESRNRENGSVDGFKITWRYQWSAGLVTAYRRAMLLEAGRRDVRER